MKNLHTFEEFLNESKSMPAHIEKAAKELDFIEAARLRDELFGLEAKRKTLN